MQTCLGFRFSNYGAWLQVAPRALPCRIPEQMDLPRQRHGRKIWELPGQEQASQHHHFIMVLCDSRRCSSTSNFFGRLLVNNLFLSNEGSLRKTRQRISWRRWKRTHSFPTMYNCTMSGSVLLKLQDFIGDELCAQLRERALCSCMSVLVAQAKPSFTQKSFTPPVSYTRNLLHQKLLTTKAFCTDMTYNRSRLHETWHKDWDMSASWPSNQQPDWPGQQLQWLSHESYGEHDRDVNGHSFTSKSSPAASDRPLYKPSMLKINFRFKRKHTKIKTFKLYRLCQRHVSFFRWRIQRVGPIFFQSHQGLCCGETFRDTEGATRRAWLGGQQGRVFRSHEATELNGTGICV